MSRTYKHKISKVSKSCNNHGGCPYCLSNRMHKHEKQKAKANYSLYEFYETDLEWMVGVIC